jgi:hypothetical protein
MVTKTSAPKRQRKRRSGKLICQECGFKAAHPMGLGRHRSSRHGVASQRELRKQGEQLSKGARFRGADIAALQKRLRALEERHERLMEALLNAVRAGRSRK